jgi:hypothetical protein
VISLAGCRVSSIGPGKAFVILEPFVLFKLQVFFPELPFVHHFHNMVMLGQFLDLFEFGFILDENIFLLNNVIDILENFFLVYAQV